MTATLDPPVQSAGSAGEVALFALFPRLQRELSWVRIGHWPTPVHALPGLTGAGGREVYVKREDLSNPRYGGNKVRTLEVALGSAVRQDARWVWATGAYGSNHSLATAVHASAADLRCGAALFPQPASTPARANLAALIAARPRFVDLRSAIELPAAMALLRRAGGGRAFVMAPGYASPHGALGALSAALELAGQVRAGECPVPERIVLPVGSTCTTAGLLAGLHLAGALGIGWGARAVPAVTAVRVTPWPVTSHLRIARMAHATAQYLANLLGRKCWASLSALRQGLAIEPGFFGGGYGRATAAGRRATAAFRAAGGPPLDVVYSAKSGAALLAMVRRGRPDHRGRGAGGPLLFWSTKSSAPLARPTAADLALAPPAMIVWSG